MKFLKIIFFTLMNLLIVTSVASAGDFDWTRNFNISAKADQSGFKARLEARFKIGDAEVNAVLGDVSNPSDAYILFRLGEMSNQPINQVMEQYRAGKDKGWGVLAKNLGIKPGSGDFHNLKQGQDLYNGKNGNDNTARKGKGNKKHQVKGKSKGKGKG
jgi:hypothetical protein